MTLWDIFVHLSIFLLVTIQSGSIIHCDIVSLQIRKFPRERACEKKFKVANTWWRCGQAYAVSFLRSGTDLLSLHILSVLLLLLLLLLLFGRPPQKASEGSVVSKRIGVKFGRSFLRVNTHRLMESDFWYNVKISRWRPWRHFMQHCCAAA